MADSICVPVFKQLDLYLAGSVGVERLAQLPNYLDHIGPGGLPDLEARPLSA